MFYFQTVQKVPAVQWSEVTHLWSESTGRSRIHCAVAVPELRMIIGQGSVVLRQFLNIRTILIQESLLLRYFWRSEIPSPRIFRRSGIPSYKDTPCAQGYLISQKPVFMYPYFLPCSQFRRSSPDACTLV